MIDVPAFFWLLKNLMGHALCGPLHLCHNVPDLYVFTEALFIVTVKMLLRSPTFQKPAIADIFATQEPVNCTYTTETPIYFALSHDV